MQDEMEMSICYTFLLKVSVLCCLFTCHGRQALYFGDIPYPHYLESPVFYTRSLVLAAWAEAGIY